MVKQLFRTAILSLACFAASGMQYASSTDLETISANVFNFQQKLAKDGNLQSQYKLGEMYEAGSGVEQNLDQAKSWYQQAASAGYAPAKNRLTFLEIKANGYSEKYADWVAGIETEAGQRDQTSMLLLAQMHREGIGVKKDLAAAREILDKLITTGNLSVDREIVLVDAEIQASQKREQMLAKQRAAEALRILKQQQVKQAQQTAAVTAATTATIATAPESGEIVISPQVEKDAGETAIASIPVEAPESKQLKETTQPEPAMTAEDKAEAEKRKRYETVMRELQQEQKLLAEQQAWAEDNE